jgi:tRNA pseudouridine13 synthase
VRIRSRPEDFRVDEIALYPTTGEGAHTFVRVEKSGRTTEEVMRDLARAAGVAPRDVGYAGRKDRVAVTTQWFSVPGLDPEAALEIPLRGARVLEAARHPHKLRTGHLRGNRFRILVREVSPAAARSAASRAQELVRRGLPNRFGEQRFGSDSANALLGRRILRGEPGPRDRRAARFLLSAYQAEVFNAVLAARGDAYDRVEVGDVAVVHASGGLFVVDDAARESPRAATFEISPTGPIFGSRVIEPAGEVALRERAALASHGVPVEGLRAPRGVRLRGARRPLRVRPEGLALEPMPEGLCVCFTLPPGSYATVLLEQLFAAVPDDTGGAGDYARSPDEEAPHEHREQRL